MGVEDRNLDFFKTLLILHTWDLWLATTLQVSRLLVVDPLSENSLNPSHISRPLFSLTGWEVWCFLTMYLAVKTGAPCTSYRLTPPHTPPFPPPPSFDNNWYKWLLLLHDWLCLLSRRTASVVVVGGKRLNPSHALARPLSSAVEGMSAISQ